ncbi:MAG: hypothetical protein ABSD38_29240 [Syntrophorhabdales bacterium]|jgi:hypothetical protein
MPFIYGTGIRRGKRELCVTLADWPVGRDVIEIGFFDSKKPRVSLTMEEVKILLPILQEISKDPLTEEERSRRVAEIETLTPEHIRQKLRDNGIEEGADLEAYPRAKKIVLQGLWLDDSDIYDRHIRTISGYLGI